MLGGIQGDQAYDEGIKGSEKNFATGSQLARTDVHSNS